MKTRLLLLALAAMMASCSVYHPQAVDIPLINHRGDTRVDGSVGLSTFLFIPDAITANATVSYGATDLLALQGHANYGGDNAYAQAAIGLYTPRGEHFVVENYLGIGIGGAWRDGKRTDYDDIDEDVEYYNTYSFRGRYVLPYLQINAGWHDLANSHFELGMGMKVGAFMPDFTYHRYDDSGIEIAGRRSVLDAASLLVEPQFMIRFGGERVKQNFRLGFCFFGPDISDNFVNDHLTLSAGLTFSL